MVVGAETRYAVTVDGVRIAYQVRGEGATHVVWIWGFTSNFEVELEQPRWARLIDQMAARWRVVLFDKRGTGLSDRKQTPDLELRAEDLRAVLDAVGADRAVLIGNAEGGALSAFFAATHPDRVTALVLVNSWARIAWASDYPMGMSREAFEEDCEVLLKEWGTLDYARRWAEAEAPSLLADDDFLRWFAKAMRYGASPSAAVEFNHVWYGTDVRDILPSIQTPTLVLRKSALSGSVSDGWADPDGVHDYMANTIPAATVVELPGHDLSPLVGDPQPMLDAITRFLHGLQEEQASFDRILATVLFTDIVGSTDRAAEMGDRAWKELLERHHRVVRAMFGRYRGVEVSTAGDGFFATFDGPARAVRCAQAIISAVQPLGIEIRAGAHTGEIEYMGDDVGGMAVHIGARVGAMAGASEVVVSSTVYDLVVGSGLSFTDHGVHKLKGVPGEWHLYRSATSTD